MPKPTDKIKEKKEKPESTETKQVDEIKFEDKTDKFSLEERTDILKIARADIEYMEEIQKDYIKQKVLDLQHYHCEKPSVLEGLEKEPWQSDRNLGLDRAVADSYQATLLATCWNPDSIHYIATNTIEIDNRINQEKFTKWGMGKHEANAEPEVDGFIHNRIVVNSSFFKIYRKTWEEWVDKRIPKKNAKGDTIGFTIKTEKIKFSKGVIENIPDIDDILMPDYGGDIQKLPCFAQILHLDGEQVLSLIDRGILKPIKKDEYKKKLYNHAAESKKQELKDEKQKAQGVDSDVLNTVSDTDIRRLPIDLYEWYGYYTKDNKTEKYRMIIDLVNDEFLSGKPLRKINRSGKIPFVGGALCKEPGQIRGTSLMQLIAPITNAFNNVFNQKSDFQYVVNCPFGFYTPDEGYTEQTFELRPGVLYPVAGEPQKNVYFPNLSRSMAWAESDIRILLEVLERLTGAASYFSIGQQRNKTLGQDLLVDKASETRFSLWVSRIQSDISEAIGMWYELYQDYPPKGLAERVVGENGKKLFPNLSVNTLRGDPNVQMTPDTVAGSKAYRKQLQLWAFDAGQRTIWMSPQVNPQGNWQLCADTFKEMLDLSDTEVERYIGKQPPSQFDENELDNEWYRFLNGEEIDPPEGATALAQQHLIGHMKQKQEKYHELDEEYRPNFDAHIFKTTINLMNFIKNAQAEAAANAIAQDMIMNPRNPQAPSMPMRPQNVQPGAPVGQPGVLQPSMPGAQPLPGGQVG